MNHKLTFLFLTEKNGNLLLNYSVYFHFVMSQVSVNKYATEDTPVSFAISFLFNLIKGRFVNVCLS